MQNSFISMTGVSGYKIKEDMNSASFTDIAVSLALKNLKEKKMILLESIQDQEGYPHAAYSVIDKGKKWLLDNQDKLVLRYEDSKDDEIPF